jgi:N-acetylneuraminic acid mutarotase
MTTARDFLGAASAPCQGNTATTCLYAIGGQGSNNTTLNSVEMYNPGTNTWTQVASLATARNGLGAVSGPCKGNLSATCLYAIGGQDALFNSLNSVEMYDPSANTWTPVASLTTARRLLAAASGPCNGKLNTTCIYAVGGIDVNFNILGSAEMYNPGTNTWTTLSVSLTTGRIVFGATSGPCEGNTATTCLYAIGGRDSNNTTLNSVEMYNPGTNTWTQVASLATARDALAVESAPCDGDATATCLYAIGGEMGSSTGPLSSVEMYNPSTNTWTPVTSLNTARSILGAASGPCQGNTSATCLYAIGGQDSSSKYLSSVEMSGPGLTTWTPVASLTTYRSALGAASGPCQGNTTATCLYAISGYCCNQALTSVEIYNPSANTWRTLPASLTTGRIFFGATSGPCEGNTTATCLYAIGGDDVSFHGMSSVEMYDPSTNTWTPVASLTTNRSHLGAASGPCLLNATTTCLYAIGGYTPDPGLGGQLNWTKTVEMYNPSTNTWTPVTSLNTARSILGAASGPCQGNTSATCLYAIGGQDSSSKYLSSVEMYDPSTNTWTPVASLITARGYLGAASGPCQGNTSATCLYAIGGSNGMVLYTVEMYDPSTNTWTTLSTSLYTPRYELGAASGPCQGKTTATCLYAIGGGDANRNILSSVEMFDPSGTPTMAWVRHFTAHRQSGTIAFQWRVPQPQGILGFNLYAGAHRLNPHLILAHARPQYRYRVRYGGSGPFSLGVTLSTGQEKRVPLG